MVFLDILYEIIVSFPLKYLFLSFIVQVSIKFKCSLKNKDYFLKIHGMVFK